MLLRFTLGCRKPRKYSTCLYVPGILLGGVMAFLLVVLIYKSQAELTPSTILELSLISFMLIPFFLPKMHERYFFPADVISIAFAFYFPQIFLYSNCNECEFHFYRMSRIYLNRRQYLSPFLTLGLLIAICILVKNAITNLYTSEIESDSDRMKSNQETSNFGLCHHHHWNRAGNCHTV